MKTTALALSAVLSAASLMAADKEKEDPQATVAAFVDQCEGRYGADAAAHTVWQMSCVMYTAGFVDGARVAQGLWSTQSTARSACLPDEGLSNDEWRGIIVGQLRLFMVKNPEVRTYHKRIGIAAALASAFPCK